MAKTAKHLTPTINRDLTPQRTTCLDCGRHLRADYINRRTIATLAGVTRLSGHENRLPLDSPAESSGSAPRRTKRGT